MTGTLLTCLASLTGLALPGAALAAEATFYLGTFTSQKVPEGTTSEGIYAGRLDLETGRLKPLVLAAKAREPWFVAISRDGSRVYSTLELPPEAGAGPREGAVGAYRRQADGTLQPLNEQPSGGAIACHLSVNGAGSHVLVANYTGASIAGFSTGKEGELSGRTAFHQLTGTGHDPKRQRQSHPHAIYFAPDERFAYVCDLGTDEIRPYRIDAETGALQPIEAASAKCPPGSGPRHLAFSHGGRFVHVGNEMGLSVTTFARDGVTGALKQLETLPAIPEDAPREKVTIAEVIAHPSGKWLYVSIRGRDTLTVFSIGDDGRLTWVEETPAGVQIPWGFDIDPTGHWLVIGGQKDNRIAVLKIDPATGKLSATGEEATIGAPVCVVFAPLRE